jgi:hypothetical protein
MSGSQVSWRASRWFEAAGCGPAAVAHARRLVARLYLVALDSELLDEAAMLAPRSLIRSLDAIHVASAQLLGPT